MTSRVVVPDVLRGFAIVAMLVAHSSPLLPDLAKPAAFLMGQLNDIASPLFVLVMGMAAALTIDRGDPGRGRWITVLQNEARGLILVLLGVWLSSWGSWIAIVLVPLGVTLMAGAPLLLLGRRAVITVIVVVVLVGGPIAVYAQVQNGLTEVPQTSFTNVVVSGLLTNPHYRALSLLPFFLGGGLLLRHGFRRGPLAWAMLIASPVLFLVKPLYERLSGADAVSGSYADTLHDLSLVLFVVSAVVLLDSVRKGTAHRVIQGLFLPLRAIGTVALSLYLLQVAVVAWMAANPAPGQYLDDDWLRTAVLVLGLPALGLAWWYLVGDGPVEWLVRFVTFRRRRPRRAATEPEPEAAPVP